VHTDDILDRYAVLFSLYLLMRLYGCACACSCAFVCLCLCVRVVCVCAGRYLFLNDTLVAPIFTSIKNETSRTLWVPPGDWQDAWDGSVVTGPKNITTTQPYERLPMWHNKNGGLIVTTTTTNATPAMRIDDADWSTLTLEAFPPRKGVSATTRRLMVPRNATFDARTEIVFETTEDGTVTFNIAAPNPAAAAAAASTTAAANHQQQAWVVRLHLFPGQRVEMVTVDGEVLTKASDGGGGDGGVGTFWHIAPVDKGSYGFFPLGGAGTAPAENAGYVAEFEVPAAPVEVARRVVAQIA
jgi:hypothetical protein